MNIGIVGPAGSGKSTLFQALTGMKGGISGKSSVVRGIAALPDDRLSLVAQVYDSRKTAYATVEYVDAPPLDTEGLKRESFRAGFIHGLEGVQALLLVIPCFIPGQIEEAAGLINAIEAELLISDLIVIEDRLARIQRDLQRGVKGGIALEAENLERCKTSLENETPLREERFSEDEDRRLRSFGFLTMHPMHPILNIAEEDIFRAAETIAKVAGGLTHTRELSAVCAAVEAEINELPAEEIPAFLDEMGIEESAKNKIIRCTRKMLDLFTFYTGNEKEAHAWDIKRGATAVKAAGIVHSDMERGFIRAEVIHYPDMETRPKIADLRSAGLIHLEGRDYIVQDGDIILFRFNV